MKNNTAELKAALERALHLIPQDFALQETVSHVRAAIASVNKVESRRGQQQRNQQQMEAYQAQQREKLGFPQVQQNPYAMNAKEATMVIKTLDKMIEEEKKNLAKILQLRETKAVGKGRAVANTPVQTLLS